MTYSKEAYDIDLNSLIPELEKIISSQSLRPELQISKEEYIDRIHLSANYLKEFSGYKDEPFFIVKDNEPSFDFWFAFYLSSKKPYHIELILDHYFRANNNSDLFVNRIEYTVLRIIEKNIFHDAEGQLKEISNWVREKRKAHEEQKNIQFQFVNLNLTQINLAQVIQNYWSNETGNSKSQNTFGETSNTGLIEAPYDKLFLQAITEYCQDSSIPFLEKLLIHEKIESKIIFKSNFKKISIIRPIKELIIRGFIKMNQKEAAKWLAVHFVIRNQKGDGVNPFSSSSCERRLANNYTEPKNAQIKYEHWFKK